VRQVHALEHQVNGRVRLHLEPAGAQSGLDLGEREPDVASTGDLLRS
jgi:hypothetical protein